ncbi:MAG: three-Cys-motif partner protein TcmP [Cyclobacteriaceae bacterium]|nr:three-Cys-motif partner protein TcmP [Cyclobacteriaceae bacterium]
MPKQDVKRNLLEHSAVKVRLLGIYLKRYLNIISNDGYTEKIWIHDLFCGEGIYENGGEGSPLVILREVKDLHFTGVARDKKGPLIDCHFNDLEGEKVKKVEASIKVKSLYYPRFGGLRFTTNDYKQEVKELIDTLPKLKKQKAFIFIDPYDYKSIKANDIKDLLASGKAEVLLFLPTQFMYRFHANGTPEALKDFIEELTEYKNWRENDSPWSFIDQLKEAFRAFLGSRFFVDTFTIQKDSNTVFCLFFFSSHIKGFEKMLEAKWEIDTEQGKGWHFSGNNPTLFFDQKTNGFQDMLKAFLTTKARTNGEVYEFTLRSGFLPKHANEILHNWQQTGLLKVNGRNSEKVRKRSFYLGYQYYKDDNDKQKVSFKLN